tara:strand:+ start:931 stop:1137 length:207 start_codon:yes stop_codon:yes gene_type:complete
MSTNTTKKSKIDSNGINSLKKFRTIEEEESSTNEKYSNIRHLSSEKNNPQLQWFKGSRNRGLNRDLAA